MASSLHRRGETNINARWLLAFVFWVKGYIKSLVLRPITLPRLLDPAEMTAAARQGKTPKGTLILFTSSLTILLHVLKSQVSGRFSLPFSRGCVWKRRRGSLSRDWSSCSVLVLRLLLCLWHLMAFTENWNVPQFAADIYVNRWSGDIFL